MAVIAPQSLWTSAIEDLGEKGSGLQRARNLGTLVPETLLVRDSDIRAIVEAGASQCGLPDIETVGTRGVKHLLRILQRQDIEIALPAVLSRYPKLAVRSSGLVAPHWAAALSGAFETVICSRRGLRRAVERVWSSQYSKRALRQTALLPAVERLRGMSVLIQPWIPAVASGVVQSEAVGRVRTSWVRGHLGSIVDGTSAGEELLLEDGGVGFGVMVMGGEPAVRQVVEGSLGDVFERLFHESIRLCEGFGQELEIEWIFDGRDLWIVQVQELYVPGRAGEKE